ncbi:unnamed protein product [Heterotrigona itama]|uniref:Pentraxin (PTX) domain-containing protein n=1 Tax=Heterotrigona itama TaxID=395501 RepID=A0A6V7GXB4_9HYME|nr:unnamed protein product [Heterotrigona itama]
MNESSKLFRGKHRNPAVAIVRLLSVGLLMVRFSDSATSIRQRPFGTPMHKVEFTQKGYIQFLRWELPVPEFTEFTFCLWMKSNDLTHSHPIFSYSKKERERLVRSWIGPHGGSVHLEIGGEQVLAAASDILENRWYHFCLSWESQAGQYGLWVDGRLLARGHSVETIGHAIPSGGDMVLGQEYTDFDKGLDDGIEGSVVGFNLLLASAFDASDHLEAAYDAIPAFFDWRSDAAIPQRADHHHGTISNEPRGRGQLVVVDHAASATELAEWEEQPAGLRLIKLSYVRCEIGRGSPFIAGGSMLISWTRTPVRVFGGAVLKNVEGACGHF